MASESTPLLSSASTPLVSRQLLRSHSSSGANRRLRKASFWWIIPVLGAASLHHGAYSFARGTSPALLHYRLVYIYTSTALAALTTGFWCRLSDTIGRKPIIVIALIGSLLSDTSLLLPSLGFFTNHADVSVLVGLIIEGLFGGFPTLNALTYAYATDNALPQSRLQIFSVLQGVHYVILVISSGFSVFNFRASLQTIGVLRYLYLITFLSFFSTLWVGFIIPESLRSIKVQQQQETSSTTSSRTRNIKQIKQALSKKWVLSTFSTFVPYKTNHPEWIRKYNVRMFVLGVCWFLYSFATFTDNPLVALPAPLPGLNWRTRVQKLDEDFDIYFFLFFVLPMFTPVAGLLFFMPGILGLLKLQRHFNMTLTKPSFLLKFTLLMTLLTFLQTPVSYIPYNDSVPKWLIATVMCIVFLVFPALGSAAYGGMIALSAVYTDYDSLRNRKRRESIGGYDRDGVGSTEEYGYAVTFGGMFVLQKLAECAYHVVEVYYLRPEHPYGIPRHDVFYGSWLGLVIVIFSLQWVGEVWGLRYRRAPAVVVDGSGREANGAA